MLLAHKIELYPTVDQMVYLDKACGSRRHCYNQLLDHFSDKTVKWSKKTALDFYKSLRSDFKWYSEVSQRVTRNTIDDLDNAFKHFFRRVKIGKKPGFPKFKKKNINDSFSLREQQKFDIRGRWIRIEKLKTLIKLRQELRFNGTPKQITISKRADKYFVSILVETNDYNKVDGVGSVGVDLGIKNLATLSDGIVIPANQKFKDSLVKLKKMQRKLSRKQNGSNRKVKAKLRVSKLHFLISKRREAVLHELTDMLTSKYHIICIEDLNVKGMVKNHKLARAISDAGFGMFRQFLEYKAKLRGNVVFVVNRFSPSSKMCSVCGAIKDDLKLSDRVYVCDCGLTIDRDHNAAINILNYGVDRFQPT